MLPRIIPLFPLPTVVLFPATVVPLHIFEPRYRKMLGDAWAGDRVVGMVLLKPGHEREYHGRPPLYPVGCAGRIEQVQALAEGRANILLRGLVRFRIAAEHPGEPYRVATVDALPDGPVDRESSPQLRRRLDEAGTRLVSEEAVGASGELSLEALVNGLAQTIELTPLERQALLDCDGVVPRGERLLEILEFRKMEKTFGGGRAAH